VIAVSSPDNQPLAAKKFQPLRDRGEFLANRRDDFRHAQFPMLEQVQNPQARSISHSPQYQGSTLQTMRTKQSIHGHVVAGLASRGWFYDVAPPFHYFIIP
jgi:hypothetical protein